jgi:prepilin peptidase CpaA
MWATTLHDQAVPALQWGAVIAGALAAAAFDARSRRIPNLLTGGLLAAGLVHAGALAGAAGLADAGAATVVLALPYVILFACAGGGAGDAKLMGALGAWLGLVQGTLVLCCVCLAGIALALVWAAAGRRLSQVLSHVGLVARGAALPFFGAGSLRDVPSLIPTPAECQKMPYGLAIAAGVVIAFAARPLWPL